MPVRASVRSISQAKEEPTTSAIRLADPTTMKVSANTLTMAGRVNAASIADRPMPSS